MSLALAGPRPLRVVDVAVFDGVLWRFRTTSMRRSAHARATGAVRAPRRRRPPASATAGAPTSCPACAWPRPTGYRVPLGAGALERTQRPPCAPTSSCSRTTRSGAAARHRDPRTRSGAKVVAVHQRLGSPPDAARRVLRRAGEALFRGVAAHPPRPAQRDPASVVRSRARLRAGKAKLPAAPGPAPPSAGSPSVARGDHVLYVGRRAREGGSSSCWRPRRARGRPVAAVADRLRAGRGRAAPPAGAAGSPSAASSVPRSSAIARAWRAPTPARAAWSCRASTRRSGSSRSRPAPAVRVVGHLRRPRRAPGASISATAAHTFAAGRHRWAHGGHRRGRAAPNAAAAAALCWRLRWDRLSRPPPESPDDLRELAA